MLDENLKFKYKIQIKLLGTFIIIIIHYYYTMANKKSLQITHRKITIFLLQINK